MVWKNMEFDSIRGIDKGLGLAISRTNGQTEIIERQRKFVYYSNLHTTRVYKYYAEPDFFSAIISNAIAHSQSGSSLEKKNCQFPSPGWVPVSSYSIRSCLYLESKKP